MDDIGNATSVLREEHHLIDKAILALALVLKQLQTGAVFDSRRLLELTRSFKNYLERCHHAKEDFLLSTVRTCNGSVACYPIQSFYDEHHRTQPLLANLAKSAEEHSHSNAANTEGLANSLRDVIDFYPGHIWKADKLLFPLADELLRKVDQHVLIQQFEWIESTVGCNAGEQLSAIVAEFCPPAD